MSVLTRDEILTADDVVKELVEVPEWGGDVFVRSPTGAARDDFEGAMMAAGDSQQAQYRNLRARFCAASICDDDGALLFTAADVEALGDKSAVAIGRVFVVAQRLAGMTNDASDDLGKD